MTSESGPARAGKVLPSLEGLARHHGLDALALRLQAVQEATQDDLTSLSGALSALGGEGVVRKSARHLLAAGGKRLRPLCVVLASRLGEARPEVVRDLAMAVELVHSATLLHDDVVDLGDARRGHPTARTVYGNAASIFAGDWLLVEALRRVRAHEVPDTLETLLSTIDEMIAGESLQLEGRGKLKVERERYLRIATGKTAALFRWAMFAGARAGGLPDDACTRLARFGELVGLAFQLVDDVLDFSESAEETGKTPLADLREGKLTYPLIVLLEKEPSSRELLLPFVADEPPSAAAVRQLKEALGRTGALEAGRVAAAQHVDAALQQLEGLPPSPVREALATVAEATVSRVR